MEKQIVKINNKVELNSLNSILVINNKIETLNKAVSEVLSLDKYNSVVTMDNFPDMKKSSQELGKIAKQISDFRIAKKNEETQHIITFEDNLKSFTQMFKEKQETIKKGLDVFEEQTRQKVREVCKAYFKTFADQVELREEFRNINLDDMTQTGYATATFKISSKGKVEIERRANINLTLQTKVDNRLLNLENECLKAGIQPLTVEHIQGFLYADDTTYREKLQSLINAEIKRNEQIKEQEKIKAEKEAKDKVLREQKALKTELEARYLDQISTADLPTLTRINLELQSYDVTATYELKQKCNDRQRELETQSQIKHEVDETTKEQHLKDICKEPLKQIKTKDGKIRKSVTVTFDIEIPKQWKNQVKDIYQKRFSENINGAINLKVEVI